MKANETQIGGGHYKSRKYQHWDFVVDTGLHYLLGCATKYPSRWRDKNGIEDLKKTSHYITKAIEKGIVPPSETLDDKAVEFSKQFVAEDANAILLICRGDYHRALTLISDLIATYSCPDKFQEGVTYHLRNTKTGHKFDGKYIEDMTVPLPHDTRCEYLSEPRLSGKDGKRINCHLLISDIRKPTSGWMVEGRSYES